MSEKSWYEEKEDAYWIRSLTVAFIPIAAWGMQNPFEQREILINRSIAMAKESIIAIREQEKGIKNEKFASGN